jgi:hypothetical protein
MQNILQHTPHWVWMLLAVLIAFGISQTVTRRRTLRRATLFPVAMIALSFYGVISVFGQPLALAAWTTGVITTFGLSHAANAWKNISWSAQDQRLIVPGSWAPMMLILGLFTLKFGVGVSLALNHALASHGTFAVMVSLAYGAFSGVFLGRAAAVWKVARQALQSPVAA